jgi:hypothetical protein
VNLPSFFKHACLVVLMVASCLFSSQVLLAALVQAEVLRNPIFPKNRIYLSSFRNPIFPKNRISCSKEISRESAQFL